ncbi:hypothetical protein [Zavarzinella formosa]|nr:hypothetical protein [Zavarzinella formosa]
MSRFVLGLDPGPPGEHTGLAVIEQTDEGICVVRHLERFRPGAPYRQIAE